jgi:hypothetical protein
MGSKNTELALQALASETQAAEAYEAQLIAEDQAKAHRAENERLRRAMKAACTFCEVNAAPTAYKILIDALRESHSAVEPFSGVTPSDDD